MSSVDSGSSIFASISVTASDSFGCRAPKRACSATRWRSSWPRTRSMHSVSLIWRLDGRAEQMSTSVSAKSMLAAPPQQVRRLRVEFVQVGGEQGVLGLGIDVRVQRPRQRGAHAVAARRRRPATARRRRRRPRTARRGSARPARADWPAQRRFGLVGHQQHQVPVALGVADEFVGTAHVDVQALGPQHLGSEAQRLVQPGPGQRVRLAGIDQQHAQQPLLREQGQVRLHRGGWSGSRKGNGHRPVQTTWAYIIPENIRTTGLWPPAPPYCVPMNAQCYGQCSGQGSGRL